MLSYFFPFSLHVEAKGGLELLLEDGVPRLQDKGEVLVLLEDFLGVEGSALHLLLDPLLLHFQRVFALFQFVLVRGLILARLQFLDIHVHRVQPKCLIASS